MGDICIVFDSMYLSLCELKFIETTSFNVNAVRLEVLCFNGKKLLVIVRHLYAYDLCVQC